MHLDGELMDELPDGLGGKHGWLILLFCVLLGWLLYLAIDNLTPITGHHRPQPTPSVVRTR